MEVVAEAAAATLQQLCGVRIQPAQDDAPAAEGVIITVISLVGHAPTVATGP